VSKLRENDKTVIGVGVKNSTSDLLIANCDEFIYYDDLVRAERKRAAKKTTAKPRGEKKSPGRAAAKGAAKEADAEPPAAEAPAAPRSEDERRAEAIDLIVTTVEALAGERDGGDKVWGSMVKQAIKRVRPGINESYYGFRSFNQMLEAAQSAGALQLERDDKSGGYIVRPAVQDE
jgi:hypothetical protein